MGNILSRFLAIAAVTPVAGCGLFNSGQQKAEILNLPTDKPAVVSFTGTVRGAYVAPTGAPTDALSIRYCAEPPPDVAADTLKDLAAKLEAEIANQGKAAAELRSKIETKINELSGRSEVILLTRELLYRQCELFANGALTDQQISENFPRIVEAVVALAEAEQQKAKAQLLEVSQTAITRELADDTLVNTIVDCVSGSDGKVSASILQKLIDASPAAQGFAERLKQKTTRKALADYLDQFVSALAKSELEKATHAVSCVNSG